MNDDGGGLGVIAMDKVQGTGFGEEMWCNAGGLAAICVIEEFDPRLKVSWCVIITSCG